MDNIDEILSVEGVDGVFIGPFDLSASMGLTGQFDHPEYVGARKRILDACQNAGIPAGIHVVEPKPDELAERLSEGFEILAYGLDITMLSHASKLGISAGSKSCRTENEQL